MGGLKEDVTTTEKTTQGLEAPESFWVELEHYPAHLPPPKPEDIVYEWVRGQKVPGVIWFAYNMSFAACFSKQNTHGLCS